MGDLRGKENPSHDVVAFAVEVDSHVAAEFDVLFRQMAFSFRIKKFYSAALFQRPSSRNG